jgi:hypothetical protein
MPDMVEEVWMVMVVTVGARHRHVGQAPAVRHQVLKPIRWIRSATVICGQNLTGINVALEQLIWAFLLPIIFGRVLTLISTSLSFKPFSPLKYCRALVQHCIHTYLCPQFREILHLSPMFGWKFVQKFQNETLPLKLFGQRGGSRNRHQVGAVVAAGIHADSL